MSALWWLGWWLACAHPVQPAPPAPAAPPVDREAPPVAWSAYAEGVAWLEQGEPALAQQRLERALFFDPGDPQVLTALGEAKLAQGDAAGARRDLEQALAAGAGPKARGLHGVAVARDQGREAGLRLLEGWTEPEPEHALYRGLAGFELRAPQAVADLERAFAAGLVTPRAVGAYAAALIEAGEEHRVVAALEVLPGAGLAGLRARALSSLRLGDAAGASRARVELERLAPEDPLLDALRPWLALPPEAMAWASALPWGPRGCALAAGLTQGAPLAAALRACQADDADLAMVALTRGDREGLEALAPRAAGPEGNLVAAAQARLTGDLAALEQALLADLEALAPDPGPVSRGARLGLLYGEALAEAGRCGDALPLLEHAAPRVPGRVEGWMALYTCAAAQGQPALAAEALGRAARLPYGVGVVNTRLALERR